jgi:hypothetical protein
MDAGDLLVPDPIAGGLSVYAVQIRIRAATTFSIFTGIIAETPCFVKALFNILTFR